MPCGSHIEAYKAGKTKTLLIVDSEVETFYDGGERGGGGPVASLSYSVTNA